MHLSLTVDSQPLLFVVLYISHTLKASLWKYFHLMGCGAKSVGDMKRWDSLMLFSTSFSSSLSSFQLLFLFAKTVKQQPSLFVFILQARAMNIIFQGFMLFPTSVHSFDSKSDCEHCSPGLFFYLFFKIVIYRVIFSGWFSSGEWARTGCNLWNLDFLLVYEHLLYRNARENVEMHGKNSATLLVFTCCF